MSRCENCIIRQLNALKALSKEELKSISDTKTERKIKKGEVLFKEGETLRGVFCVRSGASKLSKLQEDGNDQLIKIASSGEVLGKRSLITDEKANLRATALEDMEVCFIPKDEVASSIETNIAFTKELLVQLAKDLKTSEEQSIQFTSKTVAQRLAYTLLYILDAHGVDREGYIRLSLTRDDLASLIGTAVASCIRQLAILKQKNLITTTGKKIKIINVSGLKTLQ